MTETKYKTLMKSVKKDIQRSSTVRNSPMKIKAFFVTNQNRKPRPHPPIFHFKVIPLEHQWMALSTSAIFRLLYAIYVCPH